MFSQARVFFSKVAKKLNLGRGLDVSQFLTALSDLVNPGERGLASLQVFLARVNVSLLRERRVVVTGPLADDQAAPLRGAGFGAPRAGLWPWEAPPGAPASSHRAASLFYLADPAHIGPLDVPLVSSIDPKASVATASLIASEQTARDLSTTSRITPGSGRAAAMNSST